MTEGIEEIDTSEWLNNINSFKEEKQYKLQENYVNPKYAIKQISDLVEDDAILVADVGQNQFWSAHNFKIKNNRRFIASGGLGTMGYSIPAAVGAKFAAPQKEVIAVMGDGSFQMSFNELGTIAQNNTNIIMVLMNNSGLGMVRELQNRTYQINYGVELNANPDFVKLAQSFGLYAKRVTSNNQFKDAFLEAMNADRAYLIECIVDPKESTL